MLGIVQHVIKLHLTKLSNEDKYVQLYISICAAVVQKYFAGEFL